MPISRTLRIVLFALVGVLPLCAGASDDTNRPLVEVRTSQGSFVMELWRSEAPITVDNFLKYVDREFYDGLVFHRVIMDFMIQTGGFDAELAYREPIGRIPNESVGGPRNLRATVAMARQRNPNSADAQFFVNLSDNPHLDADGQRPGYAVFGRVIRGMDIVDRISMVRTGVVQGMRDVPLQPVVIESVRRVDPAQG